MDPMWEHKCLCVCKDPLFEINLTSASMSLIVCASRMSPNSTQSCIAQLHPALVHLWFCRPCCQMPSMPAPTLSAGHTHGHCHPTGRTFHATTLPKGFYTQYITMIADREQPLTTRDEPSANAVAAAMRPP